MKLKIEKLPNDKIRVEVTADSGKRPMTVELNAAQIASLTAMLQMATKSGSFSFTLEL